MIHDGPSRVCGHARDGDPENSRHPAGRAREWLLRAATWPAIVLRTPKGWTGPKVVDGLPVEGTFRAHQVPLSTVKENPAHLKMLEEWLHSYRPEELFDEEGRFRAEFAELAPPGERRMGSNPHANGGKLTVPLDLPAFADYAVPVPAPATERLESTREFGKFLRDVYKRNPHSFRLFCPTRRTRTASARSSK